MIENAIIYEQPLNELIRACLRIEQLFFQIDHQINDTTELGTRHVIAAIINMLQLLDRPDLKAKLAKELTHQTSVLLRLPITPEIDQEKLQTLLKQLEELTRCFIDSSKKIGQGLREIELLNNLRLHLASPGGGCSFDIPVYNYWLHRPSNERFNTVKSWVAEFSTIRTATNLILQLIREGSKSIQKTAEHGFYQELLDPQINLRMVRVALPYDLTAYPEISIGRHFLSVRFFEPSIHNRPTQYLHHLQFWISHCNS
jgi:cell division protein ZapD